MNARVINNVDNFAHPFEWEGEIYDLKYTIWTQQKIVEHFGSLAAMAVALKKANKEAAFKSEKMLLELFSILLNQQIVVKNRKEKKDVQTVDAEYLMMSCDNGQLAKMISATFEVLVEAFPKKADSNSADEELERLAAENGEDDEKN